MKAIPPRRITLEEAAVVRQSLLRAALTPVPETILASVDSLCVTGECECGCRSIDFQAEEGDEHRIADGVGKLDTGERVDVLLWSRGSSISLLEIVDHQGAGGR